MLSGAQVIAFVLLDLMVILIAARLFGAAAKKVGQPGVVGEIIAGVVLGPSLLGLISLQPDLALSLGPLDLRLLCDVSLAAGADATLSSCLFPPQAQSILNGIGQLALLLFMFLVGLELDLELLLSKLKQVVVVGIGVVIIPVLIGLAVGPVLFNDTFVANADVSS
ncbi:MAG TPA: cation:proton antiporter, partial [Euzebya sp.]|nr:cation:proton antiporter [Euzebya sp.]